MALLRLSGPAALQVAGRVFKSLKNKEISKHPRASILGHIHPPGDPSAPIDEVLLTFFPAPASYTGEDVVEISMHGGAAVQRASLAAALSGGARMAEAGEFTRRAFVNGRMDLAQAEAVAALISADSERARRILLRQAEGAMGRTAARMRGELLAAQAALAAVLDFPEDVEESFLEEAWAGVERVGEEAGRLAGSAAEGVGLSEGFTVVLTGLPNAGKSSLLNALLGQPRAIVHHRPGTTRDPVEGVLLLEGVPIRLVDTAGDPGGGARSPLEEVEAEGVRRARLLREEADLLLLVEDLAGPPVPTDPGEPPSLRVLNKCDLPGRAPAAAEGVRVSALTGEGLDLLRAAMGEALLGQGGRAGDGAVPVTVRQKAALEGVTAACRRAGGGETPLDARAVDLAEALHHLAGLVGEGSPEEVLDAVFSRFCVGK